MLTTQPKLALLHVHPQLSLTAYRINVLEFVLELSMVKEECVLENVPILHMEILSQDNVKMDALISIIVLQMIIQTYVLETVLIIPASMLIEISINVSLIVP